MSDVIISLDVLKSKEKHHYKGKGFIKNEIISFYDNNEKTKFIYDKKIKRLIKSNNESIIAIDFIKEEMKINISNKEFFIKLNSKNVEDSNEEKIILTYELGNEKIDVIINSKKEEYLWVK
mgnify:FL=1